MTGIYFIFPSLITIFISFLVVRAAAIALMMTGLDRKRAVFQALSAFTGTGFTTREAERVINHPRRRKIISWLMILGNAGIVTIIITATSSLVTSKGYTLPIDILILLLGIFVIYKIATHKGFIRRWETFIESKLVKLEELEEGPAEDLLHLLEGYGLVRVAIRKDSPLKGLSLSECSLCSKDILVLGIERGRNWIPIPNSEEEIKEKDKLVVYGNLKTLKSQLKKA